MFVEHWQGLECGEILHGGSKLLTASNTCMTSEPTLPCKRRKLLNNAIIVFPGEPEADELPSSTVSGSPSKTQILYGNNLVATGPITAAHKYERDLVGSDALANSQGLDSGPGLDIKLSMSFDHDSESQLILSDKTSRSDSFHLLEGKMGDCFGVTNKTEVNKPYGDIKGVEEVKEDHSIRDLCISVLNSQGLPVNEWSSTSSPFTQPPEVCNDWAFTQTCKQCGNSESTLEMLLCDHCEEAYHIFCLNPRLKKLPTDEWFCHHCSNMNSKVLQETSFLKSPIPSWRRATAKFEMGPIAIMLKYPEPYVSHVRIGKPFQAEVPEWSGQVPNDDYFFGEPLELDPAETVASNVHWSDWFSKSNSLSNWLQCREVHYDDARNCVEGTACGKWRRAPLSEVQTDDWDCSSAVVWDPAHADCAVPQELETEQVLIHLKYIEQKTGVDLYTGKRFSNSTGINLVSL
ncbi:ELM2 domain - like 1 [Theobroma cacao]|nr:ELM2 domain - like 1 [Theobroma cacao]